MVDPVGREEPPQFICPVPKSSIDDPDCNDTQRRIPQITVSGNPKRGGFDIPEENPQYAATETRQNGFLKYRGSHKNRLLTNIRNFFDAETELLRLALAEAVDSQVVQCFRDFADAALQ